MGQLKTIFGQLPEKLQESLGVRNLDEQRLKSAWKNEGTCIYHREDYINV